VYIIDNGSNIDEAKKAYMVIKEFTKIKEIKINYLSTLKTGNANYARNLGIDIADTRYLAYLDSDDWWEPSHLEKSITILKHSSKTAIYGGANVIAVLKKQYRSFDVNSTSGPASFLFGDPRGFAQTSSYIIDTTRCEDGVPRWDEDLKRNQDYDFFFSIYYKSNGWCFINDIPTTNIDWRTGGSKNVDFASKIKFYEKWNSYFSRKEKRNYSYEILKYASFTNKDYDFFVFYRKLYLSTFAAPSIAELLNTNYTYLTFIKKLKLLLKFSLGSK
tara:strand:- start:1735 stop:2556 length:822 start_codon:yes stop_codon:yes gene_type:complete